MEALRGLAERAPGLFRAEQATPTAASPSVPVSCVGAATPDAAALQVRVRGTVWEPVQFKLDWKEVLNGTGGTEWHN